MKFGHVKAPEDTARRSRKQKSATAILAVLGHGRDARGAKIVVARHEFRE